MGDTVSTAVLLDYAQDKVAVLDEDGQFTYVNDAAESILGFSPDQLVGENAFEYVHPDDRAEVREAFESVVGSDRAFRVDTVEYRHRTSEGGWVWLESRMSNLTDSALGGYVVSSREVTDRVEAERDRRETHRRLREIADTTDDVLWLFDGDWSEVLFCNPAYEDLFGLPVETLEDDPENFLDAIHPDDVSRVREAMERLSAGVSVDMEYRVNPDLDYRRWVWVQGEPITDGDEVVRIAGFARDITDRRRRERQLAVMDNLLRHNVRNKMTEVLGNAGLIENATEGELAESAAVIRRAGEDLVETAERQRELVDILTEAEPPRTVDLGSAVREAVEAVTERYPDATVETDLPDDARVRALPEVEAAVRELVENAVRHGDPGRPEVSITIRTGADSAELTVANNGRPIPEYDRNVLTGNHEMNGVYHSSGCGLWLVYWTVDLSSGSISVSTPETGGTRVTVSLPRP